MASNTGLNGTSCTHRVIIYIYIYEQGFDTTEQKHWSENAQQHFHLFFQGFLFCQHFFKDSWHKSDETNNGHSQKWIIFNEEKFETWLKQ